MPALQGEYYCKVDSKGRIHIPGKLLSQMHEDYRDRFVINRGFEKHLNIYPRNVWDKIARQINNKSSMDPKSRKSMRFMFAGASYLDLDSAERLLVSKPLQLYAKIEKKVVLLAYKNKVEIWNEEIYLENFVKVPDFENGDLSEDILNSIDDNFDVLDI